MLKVYNDVFLVSIWLSVRGMNYQSKLRFLSQIVYDYSIGILRGEPIGIGSLSYIGKR